MDDTPYISVEKTATTSLWKNRQPSLLGQLDMELTERCNNNCQHCYINLPEDDLRAKSKELSLSRIKEILRDAVSLGCLRVRFTGGEPLLRADFSEIYLAARRMGLKVLVFTNATLVTPELARLFSEVPPLEKIEVTVYGMRRESYEQVSRKPGSFSAAQNGIDLLLRHKVPFMVKGAVLPANKSEMEEFSLWARKFPGIDYPPAHAIFFDLNCRRNEKRNRLIKALRIKPEEGVEIITRDRSGYLKSMKQFCAKFMAAGGENIFCCGSGSGGASVDAYGVLQPCLLLRHPDVVYDLEKGSLRDAMENFFPAMRRRKSDNAEYLARCARCFLKGLCEQCPAKSWMEHGTLDTPVEYHCDIAHLQARYMGLIGENELAWEVVDGKSRVEKFVNQAEQPAPA